MKTSLAFAAIALLAVSAVRAEEQPVSLKDAPGHDVVENNCAACHSLDYIPTNSSFLNRQGWEAEVNKMINVFGASMPPEEARAIVDYLVKNYGVGG